MMNRNLVLNYIHDDEEKYEMEIYFCFVSLTLKYVDLYFTKYFLVSAAL